jgi:hypothetical protein
MKFHLSKGWILMGNNGKSVTHGLVLAISKTPKNQCFHERKLVKNWQVYGMLFDYLFSSSF